MNLDQPLPILIGLALLFLFAVVALVIVPLARWPVPPRESGPPSPGPRLSPFGRCPLRCVRCPHEPERGRLLVEGRKLLSGGTVLPGALRRVAAIDARVAEIAHLHHWRLDGVDVPRDDPHPAEQRGFTVWVSCIHCEAWALEAPAGEEVDEVMGEIDQRFSVEATLVAARAGRARA